MTGERSSEILSGLAGSDLLVMGARKVDAIDGSALLTRYGDDFRAHLRDQGRRLTTIGYGFGDEHINQEIVAAAEADDAFGLFVVNPSGRKVLRSRNDNGAIAQPRRVRTREADAIVRNLKTFVLGKQNCQEYS